MSLENPELALLLLFFLLVPQWVDSQEDQQCLLDFKASVKDPANYLDGWKSGGNICNFIGVTCLHIDEPKVYTLKLPGASLSGSFPKGLAKCKSLTSLDLSGNSFSGPISATLCDDVQYLVSINLKNNKFTGGIPTNLGTCKYLNELYLQFNQLTGEIPASVGNLNRLKEFNVSHNNLEGVIPYAVSLRFNDTANFASNPGLCGAPLTSECKSKTAKKNTGLIIGIAIGAAVAVLVAVGTLMWWYMISRPLGYYSRRDENRWIKRIKAPKSIIVSMFEKPLVKIKLSDLMAATNDFSQANVIASGRTGTVYKGILPDGSVMAIKRLQVTPHSDKQFKSEMETLGRLKHRNLVPLLGYCIAGQERLLVYKHMPNGTLQDHLRGSSYRGPVTEQFSKSGDAEKGLTDNGSVSLEKLPEKKLDWETRLKIAIGAARGLAWLHHSCNPRVIHRNISPGSLLLDEEFEPKISDFGLARLMNPVDTHISTFINGDFGDVGYVAPEYVRTLVATVKGDVYSFGVVLLELITGKKAVDVADDNFRGNLAEWIMFLTGTSNVGHAIDKSLTGADKDDEQMQFLKIGASCVVPEPKERPSMYEVFHMLRAIGEKYHFTDHNDEIPLAPNTGDLDEKELIVSNS
ncbi:hypothetical protein MPTK1_2g00800 [Marchantia polymorpha subsp. ruderalis]|nr:hypothetical protein MARPO_0028s0071 [Marchantia polymorpha]BAF79937.1 receptor-like kinase [Marchantia polymorpha]BBN00640.1 hypothetical protein Mp_2g00800 [Marchantia polymorpha subsp. ruderalis]|eukprot:PTQ42756.1 hypothetical protein MARPO_0028s0071 [Marchantia polymorpha]